MTKSRSGYLSANVFSEHSEQTVSYLLHMTGKPRKYESCNKKNMINGEIQEAVECGVLKLQRLKQKTLQITASLIRRGGASEWKRVKNEARSLQSSDRTA